MRTVTIGNNQAGQRLDKFLHKYLPEAGNGFLYKMLRKKNITLNGKKAAGSEMLAVGDEVCIFFSEETFAKFAGIDMGSQVSKEKLSGGTQSDKTGKAEHDETEQGKIQSGEMEFRRMESGRTTALIQECESAYRSLRGISILYEDDNILILNKPVGILTQKADASDMSLNEWMVGYLLVQNASFREELLTFRPSVCNRLDRNTSGIVMCGKSLSGLQYLSKALRERSVRKYYRAICVGELRDTSEIRGYLVKDAAQNKVRVSAIPMDFHASGEAEEKEAKSAFVHTAYTPVTIKNGYTLLEIELITGKTHQIRAHLADIGHPIVGDTKYGSESANQFLRQEYSLKHQLLHACRVVFPESDKGPGKALSGKTICAPAPGAFQRLQRDLLRK